MSRLNSIQLALLLSVAACPLSAYAQTAPPPDAPTTPTIPAAPPVISPKAEATTNLPLTLPKIHFTVADAPSLPDFTVKEGDIDALAMQAALKTPTHAEDTALEKDIRAAILDFLTNRRPSDEPSWSDGLNPMVWVVRTAKGTDTWWRALRAIAPKDRPLFEGLPFLWEEGSLPPTVATDASLASAPPKMSESEQLNNFGLMALLEKGDTTVAADMLGRAVTANKQNSVAAYNAGVLQMALHNRQGAVAMFLRATDHADDPLLKDRANAFIKATVAVNTLLRREDGSGRRLYDESIDTAWALINAGQYDLALYVAGQGEVIDPEQKRSEASLIIAMCYAKKGNDEKCQHWLSEAFGRYTKTDSGRAELLNLLHKQRDYTRAKS